MNTVTIGCGSASSSGRREKAVKVAAEPGVDYLCCDRLAERTLANVTAASLGNPEEGYNPALERWFDAVLPVCVENDVTIVGSFGAANVPVAGRKVVELCEERGFDVDVATVEGDDVLDVVLEDKLDLPHWLTGEPMDPERWRIADPDANPIMANAYLGADPVVEALDRGADVVITGRVADLSLFLAPLTYEFGWTAEDLEALAGGATVGHLLECGAYATGGNLYEPGRVDVPGKDDVGLPIAEVESDGTAVVTKPSGTGGVVSEFTLKNQLCHEVLDPAEYASPDLVLDVTEVTFERVGQDRVRVTGATGAQRPDELKLLVGFDNGFLVEAGGSWAGPPSYAKARTCIDEVIRPNVERWEHREAIFHGPRYDVVGVDSIHGPVVDGPECDPNEAVVRVAAKLDSRAASNDFVDLVVDCIGMGGGGGAGGFRGSVERNLTIFPSLIRRDRVDTTVEMVGADVGGG